MERIQQVSAAVLVASNSGDDGCNETTTNASNDDCPLFCDGLPSNFSENAGLAAIASLLNDEDCDYDKEKECNTEEKQQSQSQSSSATTETSIQLLKSGGGGGKVKKKSREKSGSNKYSPYNKDNKNKANEGKKNDKKKQKTSTSLGEAQLFLNMWKL